MVDKGGIRMKMTMKNTEWKELFDDEVWSLKIDNSELIVIDTGKKLDDLPPGEKYLVINRGYHTPDEVANQLGLKISIIKEEDMILCPQCGSDWIVHNGVLTISGNKKQRYQCKDCGYSFTLHGKKEEKNRTA